MEVTACDNMPVLKNNCKYMNEKGINEIFDPENMGIGTTFMEIGPKLTNLRLLLWIFGLISERRGIGYFL